MTSGDGICGQQSPGVLQLLGERGELIAAEKIFFLSMSCFISLHAQSVTEGEMQV